MRARKPVLIPSTRNVNNYNPILVSTLLLIWITPAFVFKYYFHAVHVNGSNQSTLQTAVGITGITVYFTIISTLYAFTLFSCIHRLGQILQSLLCPRSYYPRTHIARMRQDRMQWIVNSAPSTIFVVGVDDRSIPILVREGTTVDMLVDTLVSQGWLHSDARYSIFRSGRFSPLTGTERLLDNGGGNLSHFHIRFHLLGGNPDLSDDPNYCSICKKIPFPPNDHQKQYHAKTVKLKFKGGPSPTVKRNDDGYFYCPACNHKFQKYLEIYQHASRNHCSPGVLDEYLVKARHTNSERPGEDIFATSGQMATGTIRQHTVNATAGSSKQQEERQNSMEVDQEEVPSPSKKLPHDPPQLNDGSHSASDISESEELLWGAFSPPPDFPQSDNSPWKTSQQEVHSLPGLQEKSSSNIIPKGKQKASDGPLSFGQTGLSLPQDDTSITKENDDHKSIILDIPYGTPEIGTSPALNTINMTVYRPFHMLVCVLHGIGVKPSSVKRHRLKEHADSITQGAIDKILSDCDLSPLDTITTHTPFAAVPGITVCRNGWKCPAEGCFEGRKSRRTMINHINASHGHIIGLCPQPSPVQALFDSNLTYYPVILPVAQSANVKSLNSWDTAKAAMFESFQQVTAQVTSADLQDRAHLSPFLSKYKWHLVLGDTEPAEIERWVCLPRIDEPYLGGLKESVRSYYENIAEEIDNIEGWTTVLRWIKTPKDTIVDQPFHVPMRHDTLLRYIGGMSCLLAFAMRLHFTNDGNNTFNGKSLLLTGESKAACAELSQSLATGSTDFNTPGLHNLILSLLHQGYGSTMPERSHSLAMYYIIFSNVKPSGMIQTPDHVNGTLSELKWTFRATTFWQIVARSQAVQMEVTDHAQVYDPEQISGSDVLKRIVVEECQYLKEGEFTVMNELLELGHFAKYLTTQQVHLPRTLWKDRIGEELILDGHPLPMTAFRNMFKQLLKRATRILDVDILLGLKTPDLSADHIYDDLANETPGYSFITDTRNPFHKHAEFLLNAMMDRDVSGDRFCYQGHSNDSGISWNMNGIMGLFEFANNFSSDLFGLCHYGSGQPPRGTEVCVMTLINTVLHPRSVYYFDDLVNLVSLYNKTQEITQAQRLISRALEPEVGKLFIKWNTLVVPALVCLANAVKPHLDAAVRLRTLVFTSLRRLWTSDDLSSILSSISGKTVAAGGLGLAMGIAHTRHFLIAIMWRHFRKEVDNQGLGEELLSEQAGHHLETGYKIYSVDYCSIGNVPETRLLGFSFLSRLQHKFIRTSKSASPPAPAEVSSSSHISPPLITDLERIIFNMAPGLATQISATLSPRITSNIADGYAAIAPISSSLPLNQVDSGFKIGLAGADIEGMSISKERYLELRLVLGAGAAFKSKAQAVAAELVAQRQHDLFILLPTGSGKTLPIMMAAVNQTLPPLITIMIVPLIALVEDLFRRMKASRIRVITWAGIKPGATSLCARVVLVNVENAVSERFLTFARQLHSTGQLGRIVMDEIHYLRTASYYRPLLNFLDSIRAVGSIQIILMTASLPLSEINGLVVQLKLMPSATILVRAPLVQPNIRYSIFNLLNVWDYTDREARFKDDNGTVWTIDCYIREVETTLRQKDRILVYCLSIEDAKHLARKLSCGCVYAAEPNRGEILQNWMTGASRSKVLIATCCLSAGIDCEAVHLILHWGAPRSMIDQDQEIGRAGRDGEKACSVILWDPARRNHQAFIAGEEVETEWLKKGATQCLRIGIGQYLEEKGHSCFELGVVELCQFCERSLVSTRVIKKLPQLGSVAMDGALNKLGESSQQGLQSLALNRKASQPTNPIDSDYNLFGKRKRVDALSAPSSTKAHRTSAESSRASTPVTIARTISTAPPDHISVPAMQRSQSDQGIPTSGSSVALSVQIATSRAQNHENSQKIAVITGRQRRSQTLNAMVEFNKHFLEGGDTCCPCWLNDMPHTHGVSECTAVAANWMVNQSLYRKFKSLWSIPHGICWHCGQLQEQGTGWHGSTTARDCKVKYTNPDKSDYLHHFAFAVMQSMEASASCMAYFKNSSPMDASTIPSYTTWILRENEPNQGFKGALNLHCMVEWIVAEKRLPTVVSTPAQRDLHARAHPGFNTLSSLGCNAPSFFGSNIPALHGFDTPQVASSSATTLEQSFLMLVISQGISAVDASYIEALGATSWTELKELSDDDWATVKIPLLAKRRIMSKAEIILVSA